MSIYKLSCNLSKKEVHKRIYNYDRLVKAIKKAESSMRIAWVWLKCARDDADIEAVLEKMEDIRGKLESEVEKEDV